MLKLYGSGPSRWIKPYWLLQELKAPFEPVVVSLSKGENRTSEFRNINPFSKVPALVDGSLCLYESTAICNYIAAQYPEQGLVPEGRDRALYDQWMSFITTELEQPLWRIIKHRFIYPEELRISADIELAQKDFKRLCKILSPQCEKPYLVGDRFSVADIAMTYTLKWAMLPSMPEGLLSEFEGLSAYAARHMERAAFPRDLYPSARVPS